MRNKIFTSLLALSLLAVLPLAAQTADEPEPQPDQELNEPMAQEEQPMIEEESTDAELTAEAEASVEVEEYPDEEYTEEGLPKTASPLPLLGVLGLLSCAGAFTARKLRRQV